MLEPPNPAAITCWRIASASAFVAVAPTRTRQPRSPEKSASGGVLTFSTRGSRPAGWSLSAGGPSIHFVANSGRGSVRIGRAWPRGDRHLDRPDRARVGMTAHDPGSGDARLQ